VKKKKTIEVYLGNADKTNSSFMLRTLRVPQGQLVLRTPYDAPDHWLAVREALDTIGIRLGMKAKIQIERVIEDQAFLDSEASAAELRRLAKYKLKNVHQFRKHLHRNRVSSRANLLKDRADRFIFDNWRWLMTVKNPECQGLPGLHAWHPAAAIALMKCEGVLSVNSHEAYDTAWYKQRRTRLGRPGSRHYAVTKMP
jgi:hypothetical protein